MNLFDYFKSYKISQSPLAIESYEVINNYSVNLITVCDGGYCLYIDAYCVNDNAESYSAWTYTVEKENIDKDVLLELAQCKCYFGNRYVELNDYEE